MSASLTPVPLPDHDGAWLAFSEAYVGDRLARAAADFATVRAGGDDAGAWEDGCTALAHAEQYAALLAEVHPDAEVRRRCAALYTAAVRARQMRDADPALFAAVAALPAPASDDEEAARAHASALLDFRLEGADRDASTRAALTALNDEISACVTAFSENIREAVGRVRVPASALEGLPEDYRVAHPADADGLVTVTTDYPDLMPFLDLSHDRDARRALVEADYARAFPENDAVLTRLLDLRHRKARLLGFENFPDYAVARMMMTDGKGIGAFIDRVNAAARPAGLADRDRLLARLRRDHPDAHELTAADSRYAIEVLRRETHGVDAQEVRRYLDFSKVRDGILALTSRLFGVAYARVEAPAWHADVEAYDVLEGDRRLGRIYLDMHPREGKFGHMACFPLVSGLAGRHLPEAALVCNFPRGLMTFEDLETFLHEFGHLVHAIFAGEGRFIRLAGLSEAGEWDFVEAPSQLLEEWAYSPTVLREFCTDSAGEPIPAALVDALRASRDLCAGLLTCRQLAYAALSYRLHRDHPSSIAPFTEAVEREFDVRDPLPGTRQYCSFGHLTEYSACYYTYQWSLAIAKDLLTGFDPDDLMNPAIARRYRDTVLAPGGARPAAQLIEDFLGRPYSTDAYGAWLAGLAGDA